MPLDVAVIALVPHQGVDLVAWPHTSKCMCVQYSWWLATGHCSLLASESQMVVAGDIIPLPILVPYHDHTVFTRGEETVGLVGSPVLILHRRAVCPAEVIFKHLIVESDPLVVMSKAVDKLLLLKGDDAS